MSKPIYPAETIVRYLLGSLPQAQTEQLDEFSVTDDQFASALRVAEKDLVDAYLQGELTDAEMERFKTHYLASPRRRQQLEFAGALKAFGERSVVTEAVASQAVRSTTKEERSGLAAKLRTFTSTSLAFRWGLATAVLALFIVGGWLVLQNIRLQQQMSQSQATREGLSQREQELEAQLSGERSARQAIEKELARAREELAQLGKEKGPGQEPTATANRPASVASFILTPQQRGIGPIKTFSIPEGTREVAVQLELEATDYTLYRVSLKNANNRSLWTSKTLKAFSKGQTRALNVSLPATLLQSKVYFFEVSGVRSPGAPEIVGTYSFKVNRQ